MKRIFTLAVVFLMAMFTYAQPVAMDGIAEYQKKKMPAAVIELPYSAEIVEKAIEDNFAQKGFKGAKMKDYTLYRKVTMGPENNLYDVYVKAERRSRKEKEASIVYMVMARSNELLSSRTPDDRHGIADGKQYLNEFTPYLDAYNLKLEIIAQDEQIKKIEKKHEGLLRDGENLRKRKQKLEEEILENENAVKKQILDLGKMREALEALKGRQGQ
ncbi:hypothetical protein [Flavihumibacter sp. ZG627]|uniref:hypothetical protein n=1 Tax=Flavihumibacter sp. ZG627 TaxID=1463156 RepID=UPI00057D1B68|nr:hypothetical protein [Flavihumibacter sp. ZG627]KIC89189.1 hypothetical protein HY58_18225 [Flavihumibacter sp. ZG627]